MKDFFRHIMCGMWHGRANKYVRKNNTNKALDCYFRALELSEKIGDEGMKALELENISNIYLAIENYEVAKKFAEKSLLIYVKKEKDDIVYSDGRKRVNVLLNKIHARSNSAN